MRILLAIDDSTSSESAVRMVIEQAQPGKTEVRVLNILKAPSLLVAREMGGYDASLENSWQIQEEAAEALVEDVAERVRATGAKTSWSVELGEPGAQILEAADNWHADLIVIGSDQRTRRAGFLPRGIPEAIARRARCSVEIVRIPKEEIMGMV